MGGSGQAGFVPDLNKELRKAEYDNLNKEILDNSNKIYVVLNVCVTASGALLAWVVTRAPESIPFGTGSIPLLCLLPFTIILPSIMLVRSSLSSTARIAGYVKVMYEDRDPESICWQRSMQAWRQQDGPRHLMKGLSAVFTVLAGLSVLTSVLSAIAVVPPTGAREPLTYLVYGAPPAAVLIFFIRIMRQLGQMWSYDNFDQCALKWGRVLKRQASVTTGQPDLPARE